MIRLGYIFPFFISFFLSFSLLPHIQCSTKYLYFGNVFKSSIIIYFGGGEVLFSLGNMVLLSCELRHKNLKFRYNIRYRLEIVSNLDVTLSVSLAMRLYLICVPFHSASQSLAVRTAGCGTAVRTSASSSPESQVRAKRRPRAIWSAS